MFPLVNVWLVEPRLILHIDESAFTPCAYQHSERERGGLLESSRPEPDGRQSHRYLRNQRDRSQNAVWPQFEVWVFVCIVDIRDDLLWVKQDHEIMRHERDLHRHLTS